MTGKTFQRTLQPQIENWLWQKKVIVLYGARQVGKTTLSKNILKKHQGVYLNCEKNSIKDLLLSRNLVAIKAALQGNKLVVFDEAQKITKIGEILKLIIDEHPEIQIIATGSSSFDLANRTGEPLTGRKITFTLLPLSLTEMGISQLDLVDYLPQLMRFGSYPDVFAAAEKHRQQLLEELSSDYLYKDILAFENLKKPDLLVKLLKTLALQLGNEVAYHELAVLLQTSPETIIRYLQLLEKSFVIYRLPAFSRNLRKELNKKQKIYFYDIGIRNAIIQNFAPPDLRNDIGALWENFCINERIKSNQKQEQRKNLYFWRTYDGKEIDLIEEYNGHLNAVEIKWGTRKKVKPPSDFLDAYPDSSFSVMRPNNLFSIK